MNFLRRFWSSGFGCLVTFMVIGICLSPAISLSVEIDLESMLDDDLEEEIMVIADPLEPMNRFFFQVNDSVYYWFVKPIGKVYSSLLAEDVRVCISDAFYNILAPVRVVNHLLQGEFSRSGTELSRFVINTTLGVGGLGDPAGEEFGLARHDADFGQTLGKYGLGDGFYICWPFWGPSSARDSVGLAGDYFLNPLFYTLKGQDDALLGLHGWKFENEGTLRGDQYETIIAEAFDPYVSLRNIYVQYRRGIVNDSSKSGGVVRKKPDSFELKEDCPGFIYGERYTNKLKALHHEQCREFQGNAEMLLRYTQAGTVYYGSEFPDRY